MANKELNTRELNMEELEQVNGGSLLIGSFIFAGVVCAAAAIIGTVTGMDD